MSTSELSQLRKAAKAFAKKNRQKLSTIHVLCAVFEQTGPARELLLQRRLDADGLARACRAFDEELDDAVANAFGEAREVARFASVPARMAAAGRASGPSAAAPRALHLLIALLSNRRFAAPRSLQHCGVDVAKLRMAATRIAHGRVAAPRASRIASEHARKAPRMDAQLSKHARARRVGPTADSSRRGRAVPVSLLPPASEKKPTRTPAKTKAKAKPKAVTSSKDRRPSSKSPRAKGGSDIKTASPKAAAVADASKRSSARPMLEFDAESFPLIHRLGNNLTAAATRGELDPVVGREQEVEQVLEVLVKRHANNALLVGAAGVGKTSVARAVAAKLAAESRVLIALPVSDLLAGTGARGSLSERILGLRAEVEQAGNIVLFVDDFHELLQGAADEALGELRSMLAAGDVAVVATTSPADYRRCIETDAALARRFSTVAIDEPDEALAHEILEVVAKQLETHHGVRFRPDAIRGAVQWSQRYVRGRALPDKAVAILDRAGARMQRQKGQGVDRAAVAAVVSAMAEVPEERLLQTDHERMLALAELMAERVVGHDEACQKIAAVLRRNAAGLRGNRPIGTFLLLGPTGVGKTETAKAVAELLFHSPDAMTRLDMSEYAEAHAVARLIGAPPGYVGHEAGGLLTEAVRKRPYQVVLLDEIEKAHRDVLEVFLQVFDEGRLTDGRGRTVSFDNTVLILTSNLGAGEMRAVQTKRSVGFGARKQETPSSELATVAIQAAKAQLPPELYNRLDEVMFYAPLRRDHVAAVAERMLRQLRGTLEQRGVHVEIDAGVLEVLLEQGGYDVEMGARPMRRTIVRLIEAPIADLILKGELNDGAVLLIAGSDAELVFDVVDRASRVPRVG